MTSAGDIGSYLVTGAGGMLGTALRQALTGHDATFEAFSHQDLDISDEASVAETLSRFASDHSDGVIVNAAAYTDVERAEDEPERAFLVNETGPRILARACREYGMRLVHVSTDFVFDGEKAGPYVEGDEPNPLSVYGTSKLAGEIAVAEEMPDALIVRTAWAYGPPTGGFPGKILAAAERGRPLRVVTDEVGSPTYTPHLAEAVLGLVTAEATGTYHLAGGGSCTRYELATEVLRLAGIDMPIEPVTSDEFPTKARRLRNSVLDCGRAASWRVRVPAWSEGLREWATHGRLLPDTA